MLEKPKNNQLSKQLSRQVLAVAFGFFLALAGGYVQETGMAGFGLPPVVAQSLRPESVAAIVYQRLPNIPKENQYVRLETGKVDPENTLVSRLVRYHQDVKKRQTRFRFDWKLTLADYLGVNEPIKPDRYPGQSSLKTNPMESDVKAIRSLNRRQREELVDILASSYKPQQENPLTPNSSSVPTPQPSPTTAPSRPSLSKPGDAQLLLP
jgi:hypothetical protein